MSQVRTEPNYASLGPSRFRLVSSMAHPTAVSPVSRLSDQLGRNFIFRYSIATSVQLGIMEPYPSFSLRL